MPCNVRFGVPTAVLLGMIVFGPIVLLPQYVQGVLGFTATLSGLLILMRALPVMLLTPFVARSATRFDVRYLLTLGFCLSAVSFALLSSRMTTTSDFSTFTLVLVLSGIGQALLLVPLPVAIIGNVAPADGRKRVRSSPSRSNSEDRLRRRCSLPLSIGARRLIPLSIVASFDSAIMRCLRFYTSLTDWRSPPGCSRDRLQIRALPTPSRCSSPSR